MACMRWVFPRPTPPYGILRSLFDFPADMAAIAVGVNQLNNQILVRYYEQGWRHYTGQLAD